ncbi:MAG: hypothetical protein JNM99_08215 [Verrucomicrobiaceae bacterium]|nr:hypothetical protein [Verrucomicrobiaceae bacterium]
MRSIFTAAEIYLIIGVILLLAIGAVVKSCREVKAPPGVIEATRSE